MITDPLEIQRLTRERQAIRDMYNRTRTPECFVEIIAKQCPEHAEMIREYHAARTASAIAIKLPPCADAKWAQLALSEVAQ